MALAFAFTAAAHAEVPFPPPGVCVSPNGRVFTAGYAETWGELYRQDTLTEGEVLVPSVVMGAGTETRNKFYNSTAKTWYFKTKKDSLYNQYWCIAKNGDMLTIADNPEKIIHYKFGGLDTNSNPIWEARNATATPAPEPNNTRMFHYVADRVQDHERYNHEVAYQTALPHFQKLRARSVKSLLECTPRYIGRDVVLLRRLSQAGGMQIITNTGWYAAGVAPRT